MRRLNVPLFALLMSLMGAAHSMDGVFDRSEEINKYIGLMKTGTTGTLGVAAKDISVSGISDPQLAAALNERLLSDYKSISRDRAGEVYGVWMVRALASFGIADYAGTLRTVGSGSSNGKTRTASKEAIPTIAWNQAKNKVMASRQYHHEGDDPAVSRLMNLLMSDDFEYKHYAAERMNWERILDKRLMAALAPQVQKYADGGYKHLSVKDEDTIANFIKLLGYSKDVQYRGLMESLIASKDTSLGVKRHAKYALDKLF